MILFSLGDQKSDRHKQCQELRQHNGQPYAGNADQLRQDQHDDDLECEGAQEGNRCGYSSVVQCCEEGGTPHIHATDKEGNGVDTESPGSHFQQFLIIACKNFHQWPRKNLGSCQEDYATGRDNDQTFPAQIFQFRMIASPVVEADDRRRSQGITEIQGHEDNIHIHNDTICRHAVFSGRFHQLKVIEHTNNGRRQIRHQFGRTVHAGLPDDFSVPLCFSQPQQTVVFSGKIDYRDHSANDLSCRRCQRRSRQSQREHHDQHVIQYRVGQSRDHIYL